jgi:DNA (cytosine-5)-methyltransferase 1
MRFLSVCSGIEAASVAWHPIGWNALAFSEIEAFPRAVLAHHYPDVPLHGDFTVLRDQQWIADADVLVGGTPCQAFSVAGLRQSLQDDRGNLTLEYVRLADAVDDLRRARGEQPAIVVWENVPGVLSVKDNAFGCFLAALVGNDAPVVYTGKRWTNAGLVIGPKRAAAWRVLDAQYFGVAQRRRRVFVVASARDGFDPAEVLFEREGVPRNTPPSRSTGKAAPTIPARSSAGGGLGTDFDCDGGLIASTLKANNGGGGFGSDPSETFVPVAFHPTQDPITSTDGTTHALGCGSSGGQASVAVAFDLRGREGGAQLEGPHDTANIRAASGGSSRSYVAQAFDILGTPATNAGRETDIHTALRARAPGASENSTTTVISQSMAVRRLTPRECERLQGFPDDYTLIPVRNKPAADGPRYKALGNSMAVPVMHWIGKRIQQHVEVQQ